MSVREFADLLHGFGPAVANHLWQSTAFAAGAAALAFALRKNQARARYWIWMAASLKFLVPFALMAAAVGSLAPRHVVAPANAAVYTAVDQVSEPFVLPLMPVESVVQEAPPVYWWAMALAGVWSVGFCVGLVTWCVRWRGVAGVVRSAMPMTEGRELAALGRITAAAGVKQRIRMRVSESAMEPGIFGIARPVLLWPAAISARLGDEQLEAVLAHEVCHVRRRDNLTALLHMFVEAVFWFHPVVWWMGARLLAERERACDEAVIALCPQPQVYAESILKVCEFCVESPLACVSGITGADLKRRVVDIMTARAVRRRLSLGAKVAIAAAATLAAAVPVVLGTTKILPIYAEILKPNGPLPSFEEVTIKPSQPDARGKGFNTQGRHLQTMNTSVSDLVRFAYDVEQRQVEGLPGWAESERYDIAGVAPSDLPGDPNWKLMLQKLLADRFGLQFHIATTEMPVYELRVAKNGPKLTPAKSDSEHNELYLGASASGPGVTLHAKAATMAVLVKVLGSTEFDRPVVDRTGITGKFYFEMTFLSDRRKGGVAAPPMEDEPNAPPGIFTAIQDQLGLKLEPAKGPVETLVIDKVQKPELDVAGGGAMPAQSSTLQGQASQSDPAIDPCATPEGAKFDVVSIKLSKGSSGDWDSDSSADGVTASGTTKNLIEAAFGLRDFQLMGGPDWLSSDTFEIRGKFDPPDSAATSAEQNANAVRWVQRYRFLLAEHYRFKCHMSTKELPVYDLVVAKRGPKLKPAVGDANGHSTSRHRDAHGMHAVGSGVDLQRIAALLTRGLDRTVVDKTGLTGTYDFTLDWKPESPVERNETGGEASLPALPSAIEEQLGLKLVPSKGPVPVLVIDHIERPSLDSGQLMQSLKATMSAQADAPTAAPTFLRVAQMQQSEPPKPLEFEVAAVKPASAQSKDWGTGMDFLPGGTVKLTNISAYMLVEFAYGVPYQSPRMSGGPDWAHTERYDIVAKAPEEALPSGLTNKERNSRIRSMVQALLAERFRLSVQKGVKDVPVYNLAVGKGGPKLQPSKATVSDCVAGATFDGFACHQLNGGQGRGLHGTAVNMADIVQFVESWADRPMIDKTGLTGLYAINTDGWVPMRLTAPRNPNAPNGDEGLSDPLRQTLFGVFQSVGLKLEPSTAPIEVYTINHIERPSQN